MHLHNHFCHGKAISITYTEYMSVALVIEHAKCMHCIILSSVACLVLPYFSPLFVFWREVTEHEMCVLIFYTTFVWNCYHSKKNWGRCYKCSRLHVKCLLFTLDFNESWISWTDFQKYSYQISWKSIQWKLDCSMGMDKQAWQNWQLLFAVLWIWLKLLIVWKRAIIFRQIWTLVKYVMQ